MASLAQKSHRRVNSGIGLRMGQPLSSRAPWKWIRMLWARPRLVDVRSAGTRKSVVFALDANGLATWKMFFSLKLLSILARKLSLIGRQWTRSIRVGGCLQTLGGGKLAICFLLSLILGAGLFPCLVGKVSAAFRCGNSKPRVCVIL